MILRPLFFVFAAFTFGHPTVGVALDIRTAKEIETKVKWALAEKKDEDSYAKTLGVFEELSGSELISPFGDFYVSAESLVFENISRLIAKAHISHNQELLDLHERTAAQLEDLNLYEMESNFDKGARKLKFFLSTSIGTKLGIMLSDLFFEKGLFADSANVLTNLLEQYERENRQLPETLLHKVFLRTVALAITNPNSTSGSGAFFQTLKTQKDVLTRLKEITANLAPYPQSLLTDIDQDGDIVKKVYAVTKSKNEPETKQFLYSSTPSENLSFKLSSSIVEVLPATKGDPILMTFHFNRLGLIESARGTDFKKCLADFIGTRPKKNELNAVLALVNDPNIIENVEVYLALERYMMETTSQADTYGPLADLALRSQDPELKDSIYIQLLRNRLWSNGKFDLDAQAFDQVIVNKSKYATEILIKLIGERDLELQDTQKAIGALSHRKFGPEQFTTLIETNEKMTRTVYGIGGPNGQKIKAIANWLGAFNKAEANNVFEVLRPWVESGKYDFYSPAFDVLSTFNNPKVTDFVLSWMVERRPYLNEKMFDWLLKTADPKSTSVLLYNVNNYKSEEIFRELSHRKIDESHAPELKRAVSNALSSPGEYQGGFSDEQRKTIRLLIRYLGSVKQSDLIEVLGCFAKLYRGRSDIGELAYDELMKVDTSESTSFLIGGLADMRVKQDQAVSIDRALSKRKIDESGVAALKAAALDVLSWDGAYLGDFSEEQRFKIKKIGNYLGALNRPELNDVLYRWLESSRLAFRDVAIDTMKNSNAPEITNALINTLTDTGESTEYARKVVATLAKKNIDGAQLPVLKTAMQRIMNWEGGYMGSFSDEQRVKVDAVLDCLIRSGNAEARELVKNWSQDQRPYMAQPAIEALSRVNDK